MSEKKPVPIFAVTVNQNNKICPVCAKASYSRDGIHPQCAMIRVDAPGKTRLAAAKKAQVEERKRTLPKPSKVRRVTKCKTQVAARP